MRTRDVGIILVALAGISLFPVYVEGNGLQAGNAGEAQKYGGRELAVDYYQAEDAYENDCGFRDDFDGCPSSDICDMGNEGAWMEWTDVDGGNGGPADLTIKYAIMRKNKNTARKCDLRVNGRFERTINFPATGSDWENWDEKEIDSVDLDAGNNNRIRLVVATKKGGPNVCWLKVSSASGPSSMSDCDKTCSSNWDCTGDCPVCINSRCQDKAKCYEACDSNWDCESTGACSVCNNGLCHRSSGCGGYCIFNNDCSDACPDCVQRRCKNPVCHEGQIKTYRSGSFRKGPWCWGHNRGAQYVGGQCHAGYERYSPGTRVTSGNIHTVACGGFQHSVHDVDPSTWASSDTTDCRLRIPYCEHYCLSSASCSWMIKEKCTNPYNT